MRASDRLLLIALPAAMLATVDLVVKLELPTESWAYHHRSQAWVVLSLLVLVGAFALTIVRSRAVALAAGVMCGGVIGNLVSARADGNWVPNPLVIGNVDSKFTVAFNLADVFFIVGNLLLMAMLMAEAIRHRDELSLVSARRRVARRG